MSAARNDVSNMAPARRMLSVATGEPQRDAMQALPCAIEAEQAVLGALMLQPAALARVKAWLHESDFFRRSHQMIFRALAGLIQRGEPVDAVTLGDWFEANGLAEIVGGTAYVTDLANTTPSAANLVAYAEIVVEKARLRAAIDIGERLRASAMQGGEDLQALLAQANEDLSQISARSAKRDPRLKQVSLDGLMDRPAALPRYVIGGIVPRGYVTSLNGHGGTGKSSLALSWCAHVACGQTWAGLTVRGPGKAVFISLEDPETLVVDRLRLIVLEHQLDEGMVMRNVRIFDATEGDGALVIEAAHGRGLIPTEAMAELEEAAAGAALVVIDNASDGYDGDENNRRQVRSFVRGLAQIARKQDAALLLLAHVDKNAVKHGAQGNSYSGSTAWHNSSRSRLALIERDGCLELHHEKNNLGRRLEPIGLTFVKHGEHAVLIPGRSGTEESIGSTDKTAEDDALAVLQVLRVADDAGITVPTASGGPATAWHALEPLPELGKEFRTKDGRRRLAAALVRLSRDGRIVRETFKASGRHVRERWQLAHTPGSEG